VLALFDLVGESFEDPKFRGCAFTRASAEACSGIPVQDVCADARSWTCALFERLARDAGARDPGTLARQLFRLYDGLLVAGLMDRDARAVRAARDAAASLLDAAAAPYASASKRPATRRRTSGESSSARMWKRA